jgi:hypothetical protein
MLEQLTESDNKEPIQEPCVCNQMEDLKESVNFNTSASYEA